MLCEFDLFTHLLLLIFIALLIRGWYIVTRPGMLFDFVGKAILYIEEEELLKKMPEQLKADKGLVLLALEAGLQGINADPENTDPIKAQKKMTMLSEFEEYLSQRQVDYDVNYAHLSASLAFKKENQAWKHWIGKPLGNCTTCASSVFGITCQLIAYAPMLLSGNVTIPVVLFLILSLPVIAGIQNLNANL